MIHKIRLWLWSGAGAGAELIYSTVGSPRVVALKITTISQKKRIRVARLILKNTKYIVKSVITYKIS
jgi:hypothetical protein